MKYKNVLIKTRNNFIFKYSDKCNIFQIFSSFLTYIFLICRPTYEFPHPLARVPPGAGYWVCSC